MRTYDRQTIFRYGGYEIRSHSETRWAAMMDALRINWVYEARIVETRHGGYSPDFYLPAARVFIEVKGSRPSAVEREKALDAQQNTGCPVIFVYGKPEMLHGELFHGLISYFGTSGEITYSTTEIGSAVLRHLGLRTYAAYMAAGEHQDRPDVVRVGDGIQELVSGWMDRSDRERCMRRVHGPINAQKLRMYGQISQAEWVIGEFATRLNDCWNAKEAA